MYKKIKQLARQYDWHCIDTQNVMLSFKKADVRVNIYWTKMTVATCVNHPTKGKTQLFRRNVTEKQLERIFKNPRVHTGKGYYTKDRGAYYSKGLVKV